MALTANLGITHVEPAQAQIEVPINEAMDNFDKAVAGIFFINATPGGVINVAAADSTNMILVATGTPGAAFSVVVQAKPKIWIFANPTGQAATVKTAAGTGTVVAAGKKAVIYCDGTNVVLVISS